MQTTIDGVTITLTNEQVKQIREAKAKRRKGINSFESVLLGFGFRKVDTTSIEYYEHVTNGWRAKIENGSHVWLSGPRLKGFNLSPLGGYIYNTPEELITELEKQL